jgi:hypothetical protein
MADVVTDFRRAGQAGQRDTPKGVCPVPSHPCVRDKCPIVSRPCPMSRCIHEQCLPMFVLAKCSLARYESDRCLKSCSPMRWRTHHPFLGSEA